MYSKPEQVLYIAVFTSATAIEQSGHKTESIVFEAKSDFVQFECIFMPKMNGKFTTIATIDARSSHSWCQAITPDMRLRQHQLRLTFQVLPVFAQLQVTYRRLHLTRQYIYKFKIRINECQQCSSNRVNV